MKTVFQIIVELIGDDKQPKVESLYCGHSGVDAEALYFKQLDAGVRYTWAKFVTNFTSVRPLPLVKAAMKGTTPVFANPKPAQEPKVAAPVESIAKAEAATREEREQADAEEVERQKRFAQDLKPQPETVAEVATDGVKPVVAFEEWIGKGYAAEAYEASEDITQVDSVGLQAWKAKNPDVAPPTPQAQQEQQSSAPPVPPRKGSRRGGRNR